jgi:hypothetical protein
MNKTMKQDQILMNVDDENHEDDFGRNDDGRNLR